MIDWTKFNESMQSMSESLEGIGDIFTSADIQKSAMKINGNEIVVKSLGNRIQIFVNGTEYVPKTRPQPKEPKEDVIPTPPQPGKKRYKFKWSK